MLHVAVLDDHAAVLAGLSRLIEGEPDLTLLAVATTATTLADQLGGRRPDVLVLDYDVARGDGLAYCRRFKNLSEPPRVVIYSAYATTALTIAARAAQADALVGKSEPVAALLQAIRLVVHDEARFPPVPHHAHESAVAKLDDEDLPVFAMLLDRQPVETIAQTLRTEPSEIAWRAERIVGRLRPRIADPALTVEPDKLPR
jgi:DNA-binding NarL/FixJ family response regulator